MTDAADALEKAQKAFREGVDKMQEEYDGLMAECPYETRLAVAAWVMRNIVNHDWVVEQTGQSISDLAKHDGASHDNAR